jgi:hypothetical protein
VTIGTYGSASQVAQFTANAASRAVDLGGHGGDFGAGRASLRAWNDCHAEREQRHDHRAARSTAHRSEVPPPAAALFTTLSASSNSIDLNIVTFGSVARLCSRPDLTAGTGASSAPAARTNLGAAASGANSDITSLSGLTSALVGDAGPAPLRRRSGGEQLLDAL